MKSFFTLFSFGLSLSLAAQSLAPNGDMESWNSYNTFGGTQTYNDLGPNQDRSQNFLRTLNEILEAPFTSPSAFRLANGDQYSGTYAVQLVTDQVAGILVPGYLGTGDVDLGNQTIYLGRPFNQRPDRMLGYYKYAPVMGDSAAFFVELTRWDALNQTRETVGSGELIVTAAQSAWTQFSVTLNYLNANMPDSINIILCSSAAYDLVFLQGGAGQIGSALSVDDLAFEFPASINETNAEQIRVYPSPANNLIQVQVPDNAEPVRLRLYNLNGQMLREIRQIGTLLQMNVNDLPNGNYMVVVQTDFKLIGSKKIQILH